MNKRPAAKLAISMKLNPYLEHIIEKRYKFTYITYVTRKIVLIKMRKVIWKSHLIEYFNQNELM